MDSKAKRKWYKSWRFWFLSFIFLMLGWGGQPYYGWNYCVGQGFMRDTDFIEELRPLAISKTFAGYDDETNRAIDMMKDCVAQRGIEFCRYVGPDPQGPIYAQQDPKVIQTKDQYKYRYIVRNSEVEMYIIPWGDRYGSRMVAKLHGKSAIQIPKNDSYKVSGNRWPKSQIMGSEICNPGCGCDSSYKYKD